MQLMFQIVGGKPVLALPISLRVQDCVAILC